MAEHDYDTQAFLSVFPEPLQNALEGLNRFDELVEVVLDLGRAPEARFEFDFVPLSDTKVSRADIDMIVKKLGEFDRDNRAGIEQTPHIRALAVISSQDQRGVALVILGVEAVAGLYEGVEHVEVATTGGVEIVVLQLRLERHRVRGLGMGGEGQHGHQ